MLWNWNTIDACFISSQWRITSAGVFAGSCIGVILLTMVLEALRRSVKEFDRFLIKQHRRAVLAADDQHTEQNGGSVSSKTGIAAATAVPVGRSCETVSNFRPNVLQQAVRALLHMLQFAVAYFIMLLAMYYNGYIIICIFIGAYLGSFVFHWETIGGPLQTSAAKESTVCCG
jgi:copper transporter 1